MLIERDSSLNHLEAAASRAQEGRGGIVYVTGEAGIGKTSLLREFSSRSHGNRQLLWGGCEALFTARPLGPLYDIANTIDPDILSLLENETTQGSLFPALLNSLQDRSQLPVIMFEDVHWADTATLDLIKYLGRRISHMKALLVLTARSDEVGVDHPLSQVIGDLPAQVTQRIELKPLSRPAVAGLAEEAGRSGEELYRVTGGNPFFLTELLAGSDVSDGQIPGSVRDAVWSRISRLGPPQRKALEMISIVPGSVAPWLVREMLGDDSDELIEPCLALGLVVYDENANLRFRHELARLATLSRLNAEQQKTLHSRIGEAMRIANQSGKPIQISRLVHHAEAAADFARVLDLAPQAAAQAARMGAHQQAAAHLEKALQNASKGPKAVVAQLNEDWSYEAGLAVGINDEIINARKRAIALWRELKRPEKVALNLRWLSRLHWYQGESHLADSYINEALEALEGLEPGAELAMIYSSISQRHMLHDRTDEAIAWGERAIVLAERIGEIEARVHALNNVGSALLLSGRSGGEEKIEESLALALEHGLHEQAARAYTNYAEFAVIFKKFEKAERILSDGIAFDTRHDLDSWTHYLVGRKAQLRMEQGLLREAETIARGVLGLDRLTLLMKLPALTVLGRTRMRLGRPDAKQLLNSALDDALATGEPQYIMPARFALVEDGWLRGDLKTAKLHLMELAKLDLDAFDPWELGELSAWARRCRANLSQFPPNAKIASPFALELSGKINAAATAWTKLGLPYEAALALMQSTGSTSNSNLTEAVSILDPMGAIPAADRVRERALKLGVGDCLPKRRRGPYSATRKHPHGLSKREQEVFDLIAQGLNNQEISDHLGRSQRTIEHHVSSLLGKMNATNRIDLMLRLRNEPWLLSATHTPQQAESPAN